MLQTLLRTSVRNFWALPLLVACAPAPLSPSAKSAVQPEMRLEVQQAWVQQTAESGWAVRATTTAAACPKLLWAGGQISMSERAAPAVVAQRAGGAQAQGKAARFDLRSCEASVPAGALHLRVGHIELPAISAVIRRIVLIADTGCRMKQSENAFQDCNDPVAWPFATVARSAAAKRPDLVVHIGDMHYRESPCPVGRSGCAGNAWGYGDDAWQADFFRPAAPLLAAAPWLFVRGNHESCGRAGLGWFRFFDARRWQPQNSCVNPQDDSAADFTAPFAVPLTADTQLLVFDSSRVSDCPYTREDPAFKRYVSQLGQVERLAAQQPHSFFLNHHPVLGFGPSASGAPKPGTAGLLSALAATQPQRLYPPGVDLVLNGHVHLFEALGFASAHPATLVLGNSGSAMEGHIDAANALAAQPAPGAVVQTFATQPGFGFATLDRIGTDIATGAGWQLTAWDAAGRALQHCQLVAAKLSCSPPL
jgi:hypothetical protein